MPPSPLCTLVQNTVVDLCSKTYSGMSSIHHAQDFPRACVYHFPVNYSRVPPYTPPPGRRPGGGVYAETQEFTEKSFTPARGKSGGGVKLPFPEPMVAVFFGDFPAEMVMGGPQPFESATPTPCDRSFHISTHFPGDDQPVWKNCNYELGLQCCRSTQNKSKFVNSHLFFFVNPSIVPEHSSGNGPR
jgi:hypothetical protein